MADVRIVEAGVVGVASPAYVRILELKVDGVAASLTTTAEFERVSGEWVAREVSARVSGAWV
jgi:hypothetical protein